MYKIAISGKANSGKNTVSQLLCEEIRYNGYDKVIPLSSDFKHTEIFTHKILAFADPIKEMILHMYPQVKRKHLFGSSHLRNKIIDGSFKDGAPLTIRKLLQDLGEGSKQYNPKIWIEALNKSLIKHQKNNIHVVIVSDLRFIDEFNFLKENINN